jgi:YbgC/YbaW family acyl-CoA thioester hydrolase
VLPTDLDVFGHVTNARYLSLMNIARLDYAVRSGWARFGMLARAPLVVRELHLTFRAPLALWDRVVVRTELLGWDFRWFYLEHVFLREGKRCAKGTLKAVFRAPKKSISPAEVMAACGVDGPSPSLPDYVRMSPREAAGT